MLVVLAIALVPAIARADENWATQRARELTGQGDAQRDGGHVDLAIERYRQAIEIDPTFGNAYLALGKLREGSGDVVEAERTYSTGIDHVAAFAEGFLARGELRAHLAKPEPAMVDLMAALALKSDDLPSHRRVRDVCITLGKLPVALAIGRKMVALAHSQADLAAEHDAEITVSALSMLIGFVDPVADGTHRGAVRLALAKLATHGSGRPGVKVTATRASTSTPHPTSEPIKTSGVGH